MRLSERVQPAILAYFIYKECLMESEYTSLHRLNTLKILRTQYELQIEKDKEALRYINEEIIKLITLKKK